MGNLFSDTPLDFAGQTPIFGHSATRAPLIQIEPIRNCLDSGESSYEEKRVWRQIRGKKVPRAERDQELRATLGQTYVLGVRGWPLSAANLTAVPLPRSDGDPQLPRIAKLY